VGIVLPQLKASGRAVRTDISHFGGNFIDIASDRHITFQGSESATVTLKTRNAYNNYFKERYLICASLDGKLNLPSSVRQQDSTLNPLAVRSMEAASPKPESHPVMTTRLFSGAMLAFDLLYMKPEERHANRAITRPPVTYADDIIWL